MNSPDEIAKNADNSVTKALIFAAGFGKRLAPLTDTTPKPLVDICGKPLIQYHIEKLVAAGIRDLVINTHWLADKITDCLGDGQALGARIQWSYEPNILDTGGGMLNALPLLGDQPFLVINADIWTDFSFESLLNHRLNDSEAHLVLVPNPDEHPDGDFALADNGMLASDASRHEKYTYAGIGLYTPDFISSYSASQPGLQAAFPLREPIKAAIASGKVSAELYRGDWQDIGTLARLETLRQKISK